MTETGVDMARDSHAVLHAILVVINECLGILGMPRLNDKQRSVLIGVLCGMARKSAPLQTPFNHRLLGVIKMKPGIEQQRELARLLGLEA